MRLLSCLLIGWLMAGCSTGEEQTPPFKAVARDRTQLFEHLDGEVAVVGTAQVSEDRGPVVVLADGTSVGVPELSAWPEKTRGAKVTVTGRLTRLATSPEITDPTRPARPGREIFLLEGARWRPGDNPPRQVRTR